MKGRVLVCVVSVLGVVALGLPLGTAMAVEDSTATPVASVAVPLQSDNGTDGGSVQFGSARVVMAFFVRGNGTAFARVEYWSRLDDRSSTRSFSDFAEAVRSNRSAHVRQFARWVRSTARNAERRTGRSMGIENVSVSVYHSPQGYGIVEYSFRWHGFAAVTGHTLEIGPVLGGLYLGNDTRLLISWPRSYELQELSGSVTERRDSSALWIGPTTFGREGPGIILRRSGGVVARLTGIVPDLFSVIGLVGLVGLVYWRWHRPTRSQEGDMGSSEGEPEPASPEEDDPSEEPPELMSPQEALLWELEQRDGRAKQKEVVDALDWSNSKGSRVVSDLRESDDVQTFRIGNENVLALPGKSDLLAGKSDGGSSDDDAERSP